MENLELINLDRLDEMLTLLAYECSDIRNKHNVQTCKDCPYKEACDGLNKLEIAFIDGETE